MRLYKIEENDANQRLDKFLRKLLPNATRSLIYKINRKDKIKLKFDWSDWKFKKRDNEYKLQIWDEVKIFLSEEDFAQLSENNSQNENIALEKKLNKADIVYEDWDLLVLNKSSWINVHPWDHKTKEISIIEQVQDYLWDKFDSLTFKPSLIHRIDRDTSWILLIAKKKDILVKLVNDFKNHKQIRKFYHAIVIWRLSRKEWLITKKLKRIENAKNENKVQVSNQWQTAVSRYKLLKEHELNTKEWKIILSEVEVEIETWRMHQIRVHMASIWTPIVWDKIYWDNKLNVFFANNYGLNRQALHASKLEFFHYWRNKKIILEARIKDDIKEFLKLIDKK